jgi:hypothetical protein
LHSGLQPELLPYRFYWKDKNCSLPPPSMRIDSETICKSIHFSGNSNEKIIKIAREDHLRFHL